MRNHHEPVTTIDILGLDTVLGRALCVLLEASGYRTTLLDVPAATTPMTQARSE